MNFFDENISYIVAIFLMVFFYADTIMEKQKCRNIFREIHQNQNWGVLYKEMRFYLKFLCWKNDDWTL